ncbi:MAG: VOC family protein [Spirochaetaceae bacterium]|nr:VOC family protein [Spirochaetaceae bacterium]
MKLAHFYLNFPGTARAAFSYYAEVFHSPIVGLQTYGETPFAGEVPLHAKDKVMHVQLRLTEAVQLMGSDIVEGMGPEVPFGTNFNVMVVASDKAEADRVFTALADGGEVTMPIGNAPWGPYFGMCHDRFGIPWMVSLESPA